MYLYILHKLNAKSPQRVNIIQGIIQKNQPLDPKIFCKVKQGNYSKKPTSRFKNILQSQTRELLKKPTSRFKNILQSQTRVKAPPRSLLTFQKPTTLNNPPHDIWSPLYNVLKSVSICAFGNIGIRTCPSRDLPKIDFENAFFFTL